MKVRGGEVGLMRRLLLGGGERGGEVGRGGGGMYELRDMGEVEWRVEEVGNGEDGGFVVGVGGEGGKGEKG